LFAGGGAIVVGYAIDEPASAGSSDVVGPGLVTVDVGVHYSEFSIDSLRVYEGTLVRFVVHNDDPINHELIVGGPGVHARHKVGSEKSHPPVPGEVSVGPDATVLTIYEFDEVGKVEFACHLAGHYEFGMHGIVEVLPLPPR
jgi:uncharacterized cupredoxin-like copper-binding protein